MPIQTKSASSAATDKAQDRSPLTMEPKSSINGTALKQNCTHPVQSSDLSDSQKVKALTDYANQLICSLEAVESTSVSAFEHFRGMLCQILLAMETPSFYKDTESLALVLESMLEKAEDTRLYILGASEAHVRKPDPEQLASFRRIRAANACESEGV